MSAGRQRLEQRLEPVEQHGQVEGRARSGRPGSCAPSPSCVGVADLLGQRDVALADQVAVLIVAWVASVSVVLVLDREGHQRAGAVDDLDVLDRADLDAGDPDVVALDDAGRVDELGLVLLLPAKRDVADRDHQDAGASVVTTMKISSLIRSTGGASCRGASRRRTSARLAERHRGAAAIGPTSSTPRSGTSAAVVPRPGASRSTQQVGLLGRAGVAAEAAELRRAA